jgi:hypothetical protein
LARHNLELPYEDPAAILKDPGQHPGRGCYHFSLLFPELPLQTNRGGHRLLDPLHQVHKLILKPPPGLKFIVL